MQSYSSDRSGTAAMNTAAGRHSLGGTAGTDSNRTSRTAESSKSTIEKRMGVLDWIAMTFLIIGGLNWGAVGLFETDVVARIFGDMTPISRAIYALVGFSALYSIYTSSKMAAHD
jgi:uncharacterized membrane protein YuzA (DUF378 family)